MNENPLHAAIDQVWREFLASLRVDHAAERRKAGILACVSMICGAELFGLLVLAIRGLLE